MERHMCQRADPIPTGKGWAPGSELGEGRKKDERAAEKASSLLSPAHCPLLPPHRPYAWSLDSVSLQSLWLQDQEKPQCGASEGTTWSPLVESQVSKRLGWGTLTPPTTYA